MSQPIRPPVIQADAQRVRWAIARRQERMAMVLAASVPQPRRPASPRPPTSEDTPLRYRRIDRSSG